MVRLAASASRERQVFWSAPEELDVLPGSTPGRAVTRIVRRPSHIGLLEAQGVEGERKALRDVKLLAAHLAQSAPGCACGDQV
jgi:hypothetical protein